MKFQALLLSLVILISLLLSPARKAVFEKTVPPETGETSIVRETKLENPFSVFLKDFYFFLFEKISVTGKNITFAAENFSQNLTAMKKILSGNFHDFLSGSSEDSTAEDGPELSSSLPYALISRAEINAPKVFPCSSLDKPDLTAEEILVKYLDSSTGPEQVIFESNSQKRWPIASLTKIMTSIIAIEKMDSEEGIIMSEKAVDTEGTVGEFEAGEIFRLGDLIKAMLISSSNDAAVAVAENFNENEGNFINEMQKKAAEIGMFSTTYLEPTGLSYINQSTAEDLAKLMAYVYSNYPRILETSRQKEAIITELRTNKPRKLFNIDKFAGEDDFIGGKTGFIDEAGRNLIAVFRINDRVILTIILGSDDSFGETETIKGLLKNCQ